jgi:hypothetical protein
MTIAPPVAAFDGTAIPESIKVKISNIFFIKIAPLI